MESMTGIKPTLGCSGKAEEYTERILFRGVARIFLKGVLSLVSLARPFLQLVRCIVLTSPTTLNISLET